MTTAEKIKKYRELDAVNYSLLKSIIEGKFKVKSDSDSNALSLGSLVDCNLTTPELVNELFHVISESPGDKPKKIVDHIFDAYSSNPNSTVVGWSALDTQWLSDLMNLYEYRSGYNNPLDERRFGYLNNECLNYYNERLIARGKSIVSKDMVELADRVSESIKNGRFTSPFWYLPNGVEAYNQVVITFTVSGIQCKGMIDKIIVNTTNDPVMLGSYMLPPSGVLAIDYKTMQGSTSDFVKQMWRYKYHIQGSFYSYGLADWLFKNKPTLKTSDFMFIVESTTYVGKPLAYILSQKDKQIGRWGANKVNGDYECVLGVHDPDRIAADTAINILGFEQALTLYKWHHEYDEWEYPKSVVETNGLIMTNQF